MSLYLPLASCLGASPNFPHSIQMHPLLGQLLEQRHLSSARLIFSLNDYDVISDLHSSLKAIREIFDSPDYVDNRVDQSVVEIALARITAAIR